MAEKEYIERGALLKKIFPYGLLCDGNYPVNAKSVRVAVEKLPAADVVEVVSCKDCKHWKAMDNGICWHNEGRTDGTCKMLHEMHYAECCLTTENHFCSYGERKEE